MRCIFVPFRTALIIGASAGLFACSGNTCDKVDPYQSSRASDGLRIPTGLSKPNADPTLRIPDAKAPVRGPCSDSPPVTMRPAVEEASKAALPLPTTSLPTSASVGIPIATGDIETDVKATLAAWLETWRQADSAGYVNFYSDEFQTPAGGGSRADWLEGRVQLLDQTGPSDVRLDRVALTAREDGSMHARFIQEFYNGGQINAVIKELELVRQGDHWLIISERIVDVL